MDRRSNGEARIYSYLRGDIRQRLRLVSGLVLFTFATTHFLNHAVGLFSLEAMHEVQSWRVAVTRSWPGSIVLLLALVIHAGLALHKLAFRETLRMPWWEMLQIAIAMAIPFLLLPHIVNTRVANWVYHVDDTYSYELYRLWPDRAATQLLLLLLVWTHGCFGLHYWLRLAEGYWRVAPLLLGLAVAVPAMAIGGFVVAGRETAEIMSDPDALSGLKARTRWPSQEDGDAMAGQRLWAGLSFAGLLALVGVVQLVRHRGISTTTTSRPGEIQKSGHAGAVSYVDGPTVEIRTGATLLEISRMNGIAHSALCGGGERGVPPVES